MRAVLICLLISLMVTSVAVYAEIDGDNFAIHSETIFMSALTDVDTTETVAITGVWGKLGIQLVWTDIDSSITVVPEGTNDNSSWFPLFPDTTFTFTSADSSLSDLLVFDDLSVVDRVRVRTAGEDSALSIGLRLRIGE